MTKINYSLFLLLLILILNINYSLAEENNEIIATVNGQSINTAQFNRLLNAQMIKFHHSLNFDLLSPDYKNPEVLKKRIEYLEKAKKENLEVTSDEINKALDKIISENGGIENLILNAEKNNIPVADIKTKLSENLLLDKYYEGIKREELIDHMVDELLVLEESKKQNVTVSDEEIKNKLDILISKQGGILPFIEFLKLNNATVQDAESEIKKRLAYNLLMQNIQKETNSKDSFKAFLSEKKSKANIIVYTNKVKGIEAPVIAENDTEHLKSLRAELYPALTKPSVNQIAELEQKPNDNLPVNDPSVERLTDETFAKEALEQSNKQTDESNEIPLLTEEQQKQLFAHSNNTGSIAFEGDLELANVNEPRVLKPIEDTSQTPLNITRGKSIILKQKKESLKDKWNKLKLAKTEKQKPELLTYPNIIPGEPIAEQNQQQEKQIESVNQLQATEPAITNPPVNQRDFSKELDELRRKIEQRRVTFKD